MRPTILTAATLFFILPTLGMGSEGPPADPGSEGALRERRAPFAAQVELRIGVLSVLTDDQWQKLRTDHAHLVTQPWVRMQRLGAPERPERPGRIQQRSGRQDPSQRRDPHRQP